MKTDVHDDSYFQKFFQNDSQLQASDVIVLNTILGYLQSPNFELGLELSEGYVLVKFEFHSSRLLKLSQFKAWSVVGL